MKNSLFYITGSSKGIGKAIAENVLKNGGHVVGLARSKSIEHDNYVHHQIDLSDLEAVKTFTFSKSGNFEKIILINNAGMLGETARIGNLEANDIQKTIEINLTSPFILLNEFVKTYQNQSAQKFILNMSSGAGKSPYDGWASYCTTKAGLDMLSRVLEKEKTLEKDTLFKVFACSPGLVETNMQKHIRNCDPDQFSVKEFFENAHKNGVNKSPEKAAKELLLLVSEPEKYSDIFPDFWQLS